MLHELSLLASTVFVLVGANASSNALTLPAKAECRDRSTMSEHDAMMCAIVDETIGHMHSAFANVGIDASAMGGRNASAMRLPRHLADKLRESMTRGETEGETLTDEHGRVIVLPPGFTFARVTKKIMPASRKPSTLHDPMRTFFHFTNESHGIKEATLMFKVGRPSLPSNCASLPSPSFEYIVHIYEYLADGTIDAHPISTTRRELEGDAHWAEVDVTEVARKWNINSVDNHGVQVHAKPATNARAHECQPDLVTRADDEDTDDHDRMFLQMSIADYSGIPRSAVASLDQTRECSTSTTGSDCCRASLMIDFAEMGFDWIVSPSTFNFSYCVGTCHSQPHNAGTIHGHMTAQEAHVQRCCSPKRLTAIDVVVNKGNGQYDDMQMPNMKVESCECS